MKFNVAFIRSKVARRVVWLFFIATLLPLAVITFFSFTYITELLTRQAYTQLQHTSKLYGMSVMDRLLYVDDELRRLSSRLQKTAQPGLSQSLDAYIHDQIRTTRTIKKKQLDQLYMEVIPQDSLGQEQLDVAGHVKSYLYSKKGRDGSHQIYLRRILGKVSYGYVATLVAQLNHEYVWGRKDRLPFSTLLCVTDRAGDVLFCPNSNDRNLFERLRRVVGKTESRRFNWERNNNEYLAVAWELFTGSNFSGQPWTIISSRPKSGALLPVYAYQKIFPLVILFALLIVLFVSLIQVRRILNPLERLVGATRRLARYEFGEPVEIKTRDEFMELSQSFNVMASQLEKQFNALRMLSEIDRLILTSPDPDVVLSNIFEHAGMIVDCDLLVVMLMDRQNPDKIACYSKQLTDNLHTEFQEYSVADHELSEIAPGENLQWIDLRHKPSALLDPAIKFGAERALVQAIRLDGEIRALFCLCYRRAEVAENKDTSVISDLIDRLAVTLATADRDEKLYNQAHYDSLTGLPNRQLFHDRLEQHLNQVRRKQEKAAVLYLDVDRFKFINDSLGHASGDILLRQIAHLLLGCIRESDTVSRLGGDEFVILLSDVSGSEDAGYVAENILNNISQPFFINSRELFVNLSIGIAVFPDDAQSGKELLAHADAAMYQAKASGRGTYKFFEESMNKEVARRVELEMDMRYALQRDEFYLVYQPQTSMKTGKVFGLEALIRWQHPTLGDLSPVQFIPLAEECGLIEAIGTWVLNTACQQYSLWREQGLAPKCISVNISTRQFIRENFIAIIEKAVRDYGIGPQELELEITESLLLDEKVSTLEVFQRLSQLGVQLAIDDFGTGYSSLSYLKRFAVHTLKIDRSFIKDIPDDSQATTLTLSIVAMAHAMDMRVVAEGVETAEQVQILAENKCDLVQGYYFSKPLPVPQMTEYLKRENIPNLSVTLAGKQPGGGW